MDDQAIAELIQRLSLDRINQNQGGAGSAADAATAVAVGRFAQAGAPEALMNPRILNLIFALLQQGDMEAIKQVCKQWKDCSEEDQQKNQVGSTSRGAGAGTLSSHGAAGTGDSGGVDPSSTGGASSAGNSFPPPSSGQDGESMEI